MSTSAIMGILILFGAIGLLVLFIKYRNDKEYNLAMAEYEKKMAEYDAAMAALAGGAPAAPAAPAAAAVPAAPAGDFSGVGEGEVKLVGVDEETAAMIIAILCNEMGRDASEFSFRSITAL